MSVAAARPVGERVGKVREHFAMSAATKTGNMTVGLDVDLEAPSSRAGSDTY